MVFLVAFAAYTAIAVFMLVLGLGAAFAVDARVHSLFVDYAKAGGLTGPLWQTMANAAKLSEPIPQIVLDYVLSALYLGCGLFLVWKRPSDWVARLLGLAFVGTAMGYNYQSHSVVGIAAGAVPLGGVAAARYLGLFHWIFHAVGGMAFLLAFLLFPNGRLVPRRSIWLIALLSGVMLEELAYPAYNLITGTLQNPPLLVFVFQEKFNARPLQNFEGLLQAEVVFFVLLFGILVPIVGLAAQLYRYRHESSEIERAQTRIVVWALAAAFSSALVLTALGVISLAAQNVVFSSGSSFLLEQILLHVTPPLFAVLPAALLVAVLRYRLFDIEIVVDRTMIYAPLTAALALIFLLSLFVIQQVLRAVIGQPSELGVALAAFVNAILFQPMRRRVQGFIDTRFFGPSAGEARDQRSVEPRLNPVETGSG